MFQWAGRVGEQVSAGVAGQPAPRATPCEHSGGHRQVCNSAAGHGQHSRTQARQEKQCRPA